MIYPIWKTYYINLGNNESVEYVIGYKANDSFNEIYHGKAWKKPGADSIQISINDVCADWLNGVFPTLVEGFQPQDLPVTFAVQTISKMGVYNEVHSVTFVNDWSYDAAHDPLRDGMAFPINHKVDSRQWIMWTGLEVETVEIEVILRNSTKLYKYIPIAISNDFNEDYNVDFAQSLSSAGSGTLVVSPMEWGDAAFVSVNGIKYEVVNNCSKYTLYYRNAYGGWDSLLIEGADKEADNLSRSFVNIDGPHKRQKANVINQIQKIITLHTSWMSDEQSNRMHHLLNSTEVYLHDLVKDEIIPVVIDSTETPYKTYKGEGRKLVNYTIGVTIAQSLIRR